jgi:hypothetical protein
MPPISPSSIASDSAAAAQRESVDPTTGTPNVFTVLTVETALR